MLEDYTLDYYLGYYYDGGFCGNNKDNSSLVRRVVNVIKNNLMA